MMYQVTMHDVPNDELRIADVRADSESEAADAVLVRFHGWDVLFVHEICNPDAVRRHPLRTRKPRQVEFSL